MKKKIIEFLINLDKRWQSMNEKQRMAAAAISVVVGIVIVYLVMVYPIQSRISTLQTKTVNYERDYRTIANYSTAQKTTNTAVSADLTTSLEAAIDKVAKERQIVVTKMVKSGKKVVSIEIEKIDSVDLFCFLEDLEKKYAIYVDGIEINAVDSNSIKVKRLMVGRI
jgi:type II secretory pathway component PulM